jgi:hypothetical protein
MTGQQHATSLISRSEQRKMGKAQRKQVPRSSHGDWTPAPDRPDPIGLLQEQDKGRVQELIPIKYGRMVASPFSFLRGSAVVMAADFAVAYADQTERDYQALVEAIESGRVVAQTGI